jgi:hypothetical protein
MDADDYAELSEEQQTEFAAQVGQIDGLRVLEIVWRTVEKMGAETEGEWE